mgnify:CR=1 FL=1
MSQSTASGAASQDNDIYDLYLSNTFEGEPLENIYPDGLGFELPSPILLEEPTDQTTDTRAFNVPMTPQRLTCLPMCHHVHLHDGISSPTQESQVEDAKKTFKKYQWPTIDMTRKSVEETAASIIKIHEIFKNEN